MPPSNFVIQPPTTTGDDGQPSSSILRDVHRVLALKQDERIMTAHTLLENVKARLDEWEETIKKQVSPTKKWSKKFGRKRASTDSSPSKVDHEYRAAQDVLQTRKHDLDKMIQQALVIERARDKLEHNEGWTLSQTLFGVTTWYKREVDNSLSIKMEGDLVGVPLFEQVAVLREVDLHYKWSPFCTSSMTLGDVDKLDRVGWAVVGLPQFGLARDGCFRVFGCDAILEEASFILVGQGVEDRPDNVPYDEAFFLQDLQGIQIPEPPTRLGSGRMTIRGFSGVVHVLSPTSVRTKLVANVNPNLAFIPQSLIDFVMRKMCGVVFGKLQHAAKKAASDPVRNAHAQRMRQDEAFYKEWLMPKFESYCHHVGWTMPPVAAFTLTDEQLKQAEQWNAERRHSAAPDVEHVKSLSSMEESAPSMNGNGIHSSASAPNFESVNAVDSSDSFSTVSGASMKSFLRDNPISQYLRELEERTQREKARKIAEGRQNMAKELRPKSISGDDFERLQQLKQAKARRQRKLGKPVQRDVVLQGSDAIVVDETEEGALFAFADRLYSHGRTTQFIVTSVLSLSLLFTLYSDRLFGFDSMLRIQADSIMMGLLLDIATFAYLGVSAGVFFGMSYVSLIYAFDSLDLGTKSGQRSKEFYGDTVGYSVAAVSGAIVALSIGRAIASVWFRVVLWNIFRGIQFSKKQVFENVVNSQVDPSWFLEYVPAPVRTTAVTVLSNVSMVVRTVLVTCQSTIMSLYRWFLAIFIRSNIVGRSLATLGLKLVSTFAYMSTTWNQYVSRVLDMYTNDNMTLSSWRGIAIDTARPLLAYAAVFLLSVLFLFNATAASKKKSETKEVDMDNDSRVSDANTDSFPAVDSTMSVQTTPVATNARRLQREAISSITVQEDNVAENDEDVSVAMTQSSFATDYMVGSTDAARKKSKRFRLRLRKKKEKNHDGDSVQSSVSGASARMKRMETY